MIASLRFAGDLHPGLVLGFALVVALVVAWFYLRETTTTASPYSYLLPGLRAAAVALTILILAGPVWHRRQTIGTLGRVIFAIDQSKSMSVTDSIAGQSTPSRLSRASRLLVGNDSTPGWLEQLRSTHNIDVVAFSSGDPVHVWSSGEDNEIPLSFDLAATGQSTDLASAMLTAGNASGDETPTAVVLLTEGRGNIGPSSIDVAAMVKSLGVKVHAIGIGSADEVNDIGITRVTHPDSTAADTPLIGSILMRQIGFQGQEVKVTIKHRGATIWQQSVTMNTTETTVPFEFDVASLVKQISSSAPRGVEHRIAVMDLQASVDPIEGDRRTENNTRSFRVAASTNEHRLLIVDGSSRWEIRYVRNLFSRNPEWAVNLLLVGPGTDSATMIRGDKSDEFPNTAEAFGRYDAIVLGEIPPAQWTQKDSDLLREFVTSGGGLIVIDGRYGHVKSLVQNSLSDLVPVKFLDDEQISVRSIRPTRLAQSHGAFDLWNDESRRVEFWKNLPAPPLVPNVEARVGAEVLAHALTTSGHTTPWMVTRLFGAGRVVYLATDQTWRWRYKVADRFHSRFWNQLLASVIQPPYSAGDSFVALGTDKIEYRNGESAIIRARLRNASGEPIGDSTVEALLIAENQIFSRMPLEVDDPARGTYRGTSGPLERGDYSVRIRASGISQEALQATTPIWVGERDTGELSRISLDSRTLQQIAARGGGVYVHESDAEKLIGKLEPLSSGQIVESDILIWQSFYWFIIIMSLVTAEWWMRKRVGLM